MSSERLDQDTCLPRGTRDALHVPFVVAGADYKYRGRINSGDFVKFVDEKFTLFTPCEREEAHGVINPFLKEVSCYQTVVVLLLPGITTSVRHTFEITPEKKEWEKDILQTELEAAKREDPECADCWVILNNRVTRL
jgi:hypothetical protein